MARTPVMLAALGTLSLVLTYPARATTAGGGGCEPTGIRTIAVELVAPPKTSLAGVKVRLDYPTEHLNLPGVMDDEYVRGRVGGVPPQVLSVPNDEDGDLIVGLVSTAAIPPGRIFTVAFDRCKGAPAPKANQFRCTIQEASNEEAQLVGGASCVVTILGDKEEI